MLNIKSYVSNCNTFKVNCQTSFDKSIHLLVKKRKITTQYTVIRVMASAHVYLSACQAIHARVSSCSTSREHYQASFRWRMNLFYRERGVTQTILNSNSCGSFRALSYVFLYACKGTCKLLHL